MILFVHSYRLLHFFFLISFSEKEKAFGKIKGTKNHFPFKESEKKNFQQLTEISLMPINNFFS